MKQYLSEFVSDKSRKSALSGVPIELEEKVRRIAKDRMPKNSSLRVRFRKGWDKSVHGDSYKDDAGAFDLYVTDAGTTTVNTRKTRTLQKTLSDISVTI